MTADRDKRLATRPPLRRRVSRAVARTLVALAAALVLLGLLAALALRSLDQPFVKRRLQALLRDAAGIELDYGATQVQILSGLRISDVVVRSPAPDQARAPELLRLQALEAGWSPGALLAGGPPVSWVALRGLALTVVRDADGQTSLARLGGDRPSRPSPPTPRSRLLARLLAHAPPVGKVRIDDAALTLLQRGEPPTPDQRLQLRGLSASLLAERVRGRWQLRLQAGAPTAPLALWARRERLDRAGASADESGAGEVAAQLWLEAQASAAAASLAVDLRVVRETLSPLLTPALLPRPAAEPARAPAAPGPPLRVGHLLHLAAQARFDGPAGRTQVTLTDGVLADGALTLRASADLSDQPTGPHLLREAQGSLDLVRLLGALPRGLSPVSAQRGALRLDVAQLLLAPVPRLAPGGRAVIDGDVAGLRAALPGVALSLPQGQLTVRVEPAGQDGGALRLKLPLRGLRVDRRDASLSLATLDLSAAGRVDAAGALSGDGTLRLGGLTRRGRDHDLLALREAQLGVRAPALTLARAPGRRRAARGALTLSGQLEGLEYASPRQGLRAAVASIGVTGQSRLPGPPFNLDLTLPLTGLSLTRGAVHAPPAGAALGEAAPDARARALLSGPAHLELHLSDVYPDAASPRRSRGELAVTVEHGGLRAQLRASKQAERLDYTLSADAGGLALLRGLLSGELARVPWERVTLALRSQGKLERAGGHPQLHQRSELRLTHLALPRRGGGPAWAQAQALTLVAASSGSARRHSLDGDLRVRGLSVDGEALDDPHLKVELSLDADAPSLRLRLDSRAGEHGPRAALAATLGFDRGRRALSYDLAGSAAQLGSLQPLLARARAVRGFDLSALAVTLGGRGAVTGLIDAIGADGAPRLAPRPLATLLVDGTLDLTTKGLYFRDGLQVVKAPAMGWHATLRGEGQDRLLHADLRLDELHLELGDKSIDLSGVSDALDLTMKGDLALGQGELTQRLSVKQLAQDYLPGYAIADASLALKATRNRDGEIRFSQLRLDNARGGTLLDLTGRLDLVEERRSISLRGTLEQQLAHLWSDRAAYSGRGALSVTMRVDSGNLSLFHATAAVKVKDGHVALPQRKIAIEGFSGEVPLVADLRRGQKGLQLVRGAAANPYSQLRYPDQHPLLSGPSFISVGRIATPWLTVNGLAGNLRIEHNLVSLNQFELSLRGGQMTGQCLLDYGPDNSTVQLRVRASRIEASRGERFDGNAAIAFGTRGRHLSGRAEILRIGRRHLLDLLDLYDAQHGDAAANRVRGALSLGFPERVSLAFDHGFATARISFGGLAGLVRVDALRGIPMGPILDKILPRQEDEEEEEEK